MAVSTPSSGIVALVLVLAAPIARAQAPLAWAGDGPSATPALRRVGVPSSVPAGVSVSAEAGYAITEPVFDADGEHHRAFGSIAGAVRPLDWLHVWLRADGRYDVHPPDGEGPDDGLQGLPRLGVRAGGSIDPRIAIGVDVELLVPGATAPDVNGAALSLEARALAAFRPVDALTLAVMFGFRFDNSGATVPRPTPYRYGDIIALGASDYHALLPGVGFIVSAPPLEVFGEVTLDALVGDPPLGWDPPSFGTFPLRGTLGARVFIVRDLALELGVELLASPERAHVGPEKPLQPQEPRFSAWAALRFSMPFVEPPPAEPDVEPEPEPEPAPPPEPPPRGTLRGQVLDDQGRPLAGAQVTLTPSEGEPIVATTDANGGFVLERIAPGAATLHTEAEGHTPADRTIEVTAGESTLEASTLALAVPRGQLRGMIRSYDGSPLEAVIRVEDLGLEARSDAEGFFELDVAPGEHVVIIEAPGHRGQRRSAEVPENGVTVMNVDLRRGRGGR